MVSCCGFVGLPLLHVPGGQLGRPLQQAGSEPVQAFEGAQAGSTYRNNGQARRQVVAQPPKRVDAYAKGLPVHGVAGHLVGFHRLKRARSHVQGHAGGQRPPFGQLGQHGFGKMQAGGGGCHRTFLGRVHGLVAHRVHVGIGAVEVGGQGQVPGGPQHFGKGQLGRLPAERNQGVAFVLLGAHGLQGGGLAQGLKFHRYRAFFPAAAVAYQALPHAGAGLLHGWLDGPVRRYRLQAKQLDCAPGGPAGK